MNIGRVVNNAHIKQHLSLGNKSLCGPYQLNFSRVLTPAESEVLNDPMNETYIKLLKELNICTGCISVLGRTS